MAEKPKTENTPKGAIVPVPRRAEFFANLKRVAKAGKPKGSVPPAGGAKQ